MKILAIASYDSQIKVANEICGVFKKNGFSADMVVPRVKSGQSGEFVNPNNLVFQKIWVKKNNAESIFGSISEYEVIVIVLDGRSTLELSHYIARLTFDSRPIVITSFHGLVIFNKDFGFFARLNSDFLLLNSQEDYRNCKKIAECYGVSDEGLLTTGLPGLAFSEPLDAELAIGGVVFADQPDVPPRLYERMYIVERLIEYAEKHPERSVLMKLRNRPGVSSFNSTAFHFEKIIKSFYRNKIPKNMEIVYGDISEYLVKDRLLVTVSSTAAIDAINKGMRSCIISDFGLSEKYGNGFFVGSGLLCSFNEILEDSLPSLNYNWMESYLNYGQYNLSILYEKVVKKIGLSGDLPSMKSQQYKEVLEARSRIGLIKKISKNKRMAIIKFAVLFFISRVK